MIRDLKVICPDAKPPSEELIKILQELYDEQEEDRERWKTHSKLSIEQWLMPLD